MAITKFDAESESGRATWKATLLGNRIISDTPSIGTAFSKSASVGLFDTPSTGFSVSTPAISNGL